MTKENESKAMDASDSDTKAEAIVASTTNNTDDDEIPPEVLKIKEKLERETGKKFKYRPREKDLPPVAELIKYGVPGKELKPQTWKEMLLLPLLFAGFFALTLFIYHHTVLKYPPRIPPFAVRQEMKKKGLQYIHPRYKNKDNQQQQQQQKEYYEEYKQKLATEKNENTNNEL